MARPAKKVEELARSIDELTVRERVRLLERVLTPETELALVVERVRRRTRGVDPRKVDRDISAAIQEVRRERRVRTRSS